MPERLNVNLDMTGIATAYPKEMMWTIWIVLSVFIFFKRWLPVIKKWMVDNEIKKNLKLIKKDTTGILSLLNKNGTEK